MFLVKICGEAGLIEAVVNVISFHTVNTDMCYAGCGALKSMVFNNSNQLIINAMEGNVDGQLRTKRKQERLEVSGLLSR